MCRWEYLFFFKQKTAYEMRISDWSSDVCSADLRRNAGRHAPSRRRDRLRHRFRGDAIPRADGHRRHRRPFDPRALARRRERVSRPVGAAVSEPARSEEHTSELQSLIRNSYAVFSLKKQKLNPTHKLIMHLLPNQQTQRKLTHKTLQ